MIFEESHLSDQELLLAADGELPPARSAQVAEHLQRCWSCRARKREIEDAVIDFVSLYRDGMAPLVPPAAGPRALLKAQLAELSATPVPWWTRRVHFSAWRPVAAGVLFAVLLVTGYFVVAIASRSPRRSVPLSIPEPSLTPGAVVTVSREQLCRSDLPKNRSVPASVQRKVFEEYGIAGAEPRAYEVDYLITPALGGADDIRNLWPQSYSAAWNAHVKDALEDHLRELVCEGKLDLAAAQHDIASNWIAAYMNYFHTDKPLEVDR
jgi:hypothetical protein